MLLQYIDRRNVLSTQLRRSERDKLDRRRSTKLTLPPSSDARPLVYHSNHQAVSTAQFHRAGQLATVDTCNNLPVSCNILLTVFASVVSIHSLCVYLLYFYVGWLSGE